MLIDLPQEADIETAKSSYRNGILEITFNKKKETKPKGKQINIELNKNTDIINRLFILFSISTTTTSICCFDLFDFYDLQIDNFLSLSTTVSTV